MAGGKCGHQGNKAHEKQEDTKYFGQIPKRPAALRGIRGNKRMRRQMLVLQHLETTAQGLCGHAKGAARH
jgi:hypothetical protein